MFHDPLSRIERLWLLALRLSHAWRDRPTTAAATVDRLFVPAGMGRLGQQFCELLDALDATGVNHLYIEAHDRRGVTGDERDLLAALRGCYMDDLIAAERALGGLVPPDGIATVLDYTRRIACAARTLSPCIAPAPLPLDVLAGWH